MYLNVLYMFRRDPPTCQNRFSETLFLSSGGVSKNRFSPPTNPTNSGKQEGGNTQHAERGAKIAGLVDDYQKSENVFKKSGTKFKKRI